MEENRCEKELCHPFVTEEGMLIGIGHTYHHFMNNTFVLVHFSPAKKLCILLNVDIYNFAR